MVNMRYGGRKRNTIGARLSMGSAITPSRPEGLAALSRDAIPVGGPRAQSFSIFFNFSNAYAIFLLFLFWPLPGSM